MTTLGHQLMIKRFCQVLPSGFDTKLCIRNEFVQGQRYVLIKKPQDMSYRNVKVSSHTKKVFFERDWLKFVKDHALEEGVEEGDVSVFTHKEEKKLDVLISDNKTLCEKQKSSSARENDAAGKLSGSQISGSPSTDATTPTSAKKTKNASPRQSRRPVTGEEKQQALKKAKEALAGSPEKSFHCVMIRNRDHRKNPVVPADFIKQNDLFRDSECVILRIDRNGDTVTSQVEFYRRPAGWVQFVRQNNMEEDDVCVFKLSDDKVDDKRVFDVNIIRVGEIENVHDKIHAKRDG